MGVGEVKKPQRRLRRRDPEARRSEEARGAGGERENAARSREQRPPPPAAGAGTAAEGGGGRAVRGSLRGDGTPAPKFGETFPSLGWRLSPALPLRAGSALRAAAGPPVPPFLLPAHLGSPRLAPSLPAAAEPRSLRPTDKAGARPTPRGTPGSPCWISGAATLREVCPVFHPPHTHTHLARGCHRTPQIPAHAAGSPAGSCGPGRARPGPALIPVTLVSSY